MGSLGPYRFQQNVLQSIMTDTCTFWLQVHIDGHNDFAVPFLVPGYPFFRMPKDAKEKNGMMQRNDVFIMVKFDAFLVLT